ncbi:MAG TPA: hypothetical protein VK988_22705 [Acidimicrobiales bacterium]|nr:hypothetical protein [Acidimicrobiales bacterium]
MEALVGIGMQMCELLADSGGPALPSDSQSARAPGTEIWLGRSTTPGRAKIDAASRSRCFESVGC